MNKRFMAIGLCVLAAIACVSVFTLQPRTASVAQGQALPETQRVPDHVIYGFSFRKVTLMQSRFAQTPYFPLQREANLTQEQARVLSEIASACMQEVQQKDERARVISGAFRAQFPGGIVPSGVTLPPPPPQLRVVWEERNASILRARDRLRAAFGEQAFARFDNYARFRFGE